MYDRLLQMYNKGLQPVVTGSHLHRLLQEHGVAPQRPSPFLLLYHSWLYSYILADNILTGYNPFYHIHNTFIVSSRRSSPASLPNFEYIIAYMKCNR